MITVIAVGTQHITSNDLLSLDKNDLNLCPEQAASADFLRAMDGWI